MWIELVWTGLNKCGHIQCGLSRCRIQEGLDRPVLDLDYTGMDPL